MEASNLPDPLAQRLRQQLDTWRQDLLTLDRRQRLVYFKHSKSASLEIVEPSAAEILTRVSGRRQLISHQPQDGEQSTAPPGSLVAAGKTETELRNACRRLDLLSQQVYADRGFWTLYLGIGMLTWVDPADGKSVDSPLLLCPVEVARSGAQSPYFVTRNEDEAVVNPALRLHMEKDFSVKLPQADPFAPDVDKLLDEVRVAVSGWDGWSVTARVVLTTFSFHKEAIYRDLSDHEATVSAHPIVQMIALGPDAPFASRFAFESPEDRDLDTVWPPEQMMTILDADSSQRRCVLAARDGKSFVMDGPPGTGKSQTISNIIAELMAAGRSVLFVSEKAAALDVVRDRLTSKGLGDFVLELHSHAATRKEVVAQLDRALTQRAKVKGDFSTSQRAGLQSAREELSAFAAAMNDERAPLRRSIFDVLGRLMELQHVGHKPLDRPDAWRDLSPGRLESILSAGHRLQRAWRPISEGDDFLWRGLAEHQHAANGIDRIKRGTQHLLKSTEELIDRARAVDADLLLTWPMDIASMRRRARLLELLSQWPEAEQSWLVMADPSVLPRRVEELKQAVTLYERSVDDLRDVVGEAWDRLDPELAQGFDRLGRAEAGVWVPERSMRSDEFADSVSFLAEAPMKLAPLVEEARQLGAMLGISTDALSLRRAIELAHLGALGGAAAMPERGWLNPSVQSALNESHKVLASLVEVVNERREAVEQVFTPDALELDLAILNTRFKEAHTGLRRWSSQARADKKLLKGVTVTGKVDKGVLARLDEAVAWQKAEKRLNSAESEHAPRLGRYYQRTETNFSRVAQAIEIAQRAVELAGNDLNAGPLAEQLSVDGRPDPRLTIVAGRLQRGCEAWLKEAHGKLGAAPADSLAARPFVEAAELSGQAAEYLHPLVEASRYVTDVAGQPLTLERGQRARHLATLVSNASATIYDSYEEDRTLLGKRYEGLTTAWRALETAVAWANAIRQIVHTPVSEESAARMAAPVVLPQEMVDRLTKWGRARDDLTAHFDEARGAELAADLESDLPGAHELLQEMADTCVADVEEWDAHGGAVTELTAAGLGETLDYLRGRVAERSIVAETVEWAMLQAWVEAHVAADSRLTRHRATDRNALVARFRELDAEIVRKTNVSVAAACSARRPSSFAGTSAQLIRREAQKKTRHLPIRELLSRTGEIVQELKPCFMMSPLSVSQYLPGEMTFDAVIFDEASQVLPSDAVNCIYRGGQLIVAGDEKQLPPTAFFTQAVSDEEADDEVDLFESVLKLCKSSMPSLPLSWHYRSQHESLITYSNYRFYAPDGDALQTFPGATFQSPDLGVESFVVNGVYRRGGARDNPIEAEAVVDRILFHRSHHPGLSIGVVTFSSAQEEAISAALERRAASERALAGLLDDHDRLTGFFVKNLENVQGDERDIIVFSIGYGPDEHGKFAMNFGPINRDGGWRRLNVAITRAKKRVEVVSSFRAGDMRDTASAGLRHLRGYLDFAERGMPALGIDLDGSQGDAESPFEEDVMRVISSWGYDVVPQVGSAGYRIDLGVRHPDRPGEYVLAVECDGAAYHSAATARDRDRLRASVLRGLGWNIYRIWGISWYRDRQGQSALLKQALAQAVAGNAPTLDSLPHAVEEPVEVQMDEIDHTAPPEWAETYERGPERAPYCGFPLASVEARPHLQTYIGSVLAAEAPLHTDLLYKRVREAFGVGRVGHQIKKNIDFVASRLTVDGEHVRLWGDGFFRLKGRETRVRVPANEDDIRTVGQTPTEEMDAAVCRVVRDAVTVEESGLILALRALFGWRRAGNDIQAAVNASVARCLAAGKLERTSRGALRATS
ncbi:DUF3320 domain-containing protein [Nocardioides jiangsuensis]|nr:DUF3320 domain-containing protein [Nocardioides jiangsuensis]